MQALLHAPIDNDKVILRPPRSVRRHGWLGALTKALSGRRVAPQKFHDWLANLFVSRGFRQTVGHPAYFRHDEEDVEIVIHIDDGIIAHPPAEIMFDVKNVSGNFAVSKVSMMATGQADGQVPGMYT